MKKLIINLFTWIFEKELAKISEELTLIKQNQIQVKYEYQRLQNLTISLKEKESRLDQILQNIDVSVNISEDNYSKSWAVISIQGKTNMIKFVDLGHREIKDIAQFLSNFDRRNIDASPHITQFLKVSNKRLF